MHRIEKKQEEKSMLNYLWGFMIIIGTIFAAFTGNLPSVTEAALESANEAVMLSITMIGGMSFWVGLMKNRIWDFYRESEGCDGGGCFFFERCGEFVYFYGWSCGDVVGADEDCGAGRTDRGGF